jgi:phosphoglycolate phosphatase-like HAD superfamily hydrolase
MLDRDILTWMMQDGGAGKDLIRRAMPEVIRKAQSLYVRRCPDLTSRVCPGARRLLQRLWRRGVVNGLVTGNLTRIGWKKMERAGLRAYLRFGAFSECGKDRSSLARLALKTARASGWIGPVTPVSLIGDHPNDILAAKANGMRSVAVATGLSTREELMAHAPDLLVDDLRALRLEWLLTNG